MAVLSFRLIAVALVVGAGADAALAQRLNLGRGGGGHGDEAPLLDRFTYAGELIGALEGEIAELLAMETSATPHQQVVIRARVNVRIIAADLLGSGDRDDKPGSIAVLHGFTIARARTEIDRTLDRLATTERSPVLAALKQFNADATRLADRVRTSDVAELDRYLPAVLSSLAEAVSTLEEQPVVSYWPAGPDTGEAASTPGDAAAETETIEQIAGRAASTPMREDTRAEVLRIIDFVRRGEQFADLRPRVRACRRLLVQVLDTAASLDAAQWLDEDTRARYGDRLHLGVALFGDPQTRAQGQRHIERLETVRPMIDRITAMASARQVDFRPVRAAFLEADAMIEDAEADPDQQQLRKLLAVLDRMIGYRELGKQELRRELRIIHRELEKAYLVAEKELLARFERLASDPLAFADPAFSTLLADHKQYYEDLLRLGRVPEWVEALTQIDERSGTRFFAQARKMCLWLLDPNRRPDAIRAMDQFEQQVTLFCPLPFEEALRQGDAEVIKATGGLHEQFVNEIDALRARWVSGWADGNAASDAANRMMLVYRLNRTIEDTATVFRLGGDGAALNAWAAWELEPTSLARALSELPSRLKLATAAAISGDDGQLGAQLEAIDRDVALARLLGRLALVLGPQLEPLPGGATGALGQLVAPPPHDAWLIEERLELAALCRYALEEDYALATSREQLAADLAEYVNERAERLLLKFGDRRAALPVLIGFDGSDPDAEQGGGGAGRR